MLLVVTMKDGIADLKISETPMLFQNNSLCILLGWFGSRHRTEYPKLLHLLLVPGLAAGEKPRDETPSHWLTVS